MAVGTNPARIRALELALAATIKRLDALTGTTVVAAPVVKSPTAVVAAAATKVKVCACGAEFRNGRPQADIDASANGLCGLKTTTGNHRNTVAAA